MLFPRNRVLSSLIFSHKTPALIFRRKIHSFVPRRRGPLNYQSTLDDIVNQQISILLTEEVLSTSGSLHPDFNNNEDPCCDSTAVTALSGRDRELAPRFE